MSIFLIAMTAATLTCADATIDYSKVRRGDTPSLAVVLRAVKARKLCQTTPDRNHEETRQTIKTLRVQTDDKSGLY